MLVAIAAREAYADPTLFGWVKRTRLCMVVHTCAQLAVQIAKRYSMFSLLLEALTCRHVNLNGKTSCLKPGLWSPCLEGLHSEHSEPVAGCLPPELFA